MKKLNIFFVILLAVVSFMSCKKEDGDAGLLPNIAFKTGGTYVSADIILTKDTTITVGIQASKAEPNDVLKSFNAAKGYDGTTPVGYLNESITGTAGDSYSKDLSITTRSQNGTEKYVFTVLNKDGLKNQVSLTITVQ